MLRSAKRRRRRRETAARRRFIVGVILFILAMAAAIYLASFRPLPSPEPVPLSAAVTDSPETSPVASSTTFERPIYPYSVIPGGASQVEELKQAIAGDPVVAAHYAEFAIDNARVERLTRPRLAYVSYRIGNSVFWTRNRIALKSGETILTDGVRDARTRCGNRIADQPGPVSPLEPPETVLDSPVQLPLTASAEPLTLPPSAAGGLIAPPVTLPLSAGNELAPPLAAGTPPPMTTAGLAADADPVAGSAMGSLPPLTGEPPRPGAEQFPGTVLLPGSESFPADPLPGGPAPLPEGHEPVPPMTPPPLIIDEQLPPGTILPTDPADPPLDAPVPVPEPGTAVLMIQTGVAWGIWRFRQRRRR
jgi:hypothetical protein